MGTNHFVIGGSGDDEANLVMLRYHREVKHCRQHDHGYRSKSGHVPIRSGHDLFLERKSTLNSNTVERRILRPIAVRPSYRLSAVGLGHKDVPSQSH